MQVVADTPLKAPKNDQRTPLHRCPAQHRRSRGTISCGRVGIMRPTLYRRTWRARYNPRLAERYSLVSQDGVQLPGLGCETTPLSIRFDPRPKEARGMKPKPFRSETRMETEAMQTGTQPHLPLIDDRSAQYVGGGRCLLRSRYVGPSLRRWAPVFDKVAHCLLGHPGERIADRTCGIRGV